MGTRAKKAAVEPVVEAAPVETIVALKGLNSDFACAPNGTPFQFEVGKSYSVEGTVVVCKNGFHAVALETPLHVWDFYPPIADDGKLNRFAEVELSGATDKEDSEKGTKIAAASVTIKAELTLPDFIKRAVEAIIKSAKGKETAASGDSAQLAASGNYAKLAASGDYAKLAASGDSAQLAASGNSAKLAASGDSAQLAASGNYAKLAASGKDSVITASAPACTATGANGTWISLAEFVDGKCVGFATGCIGKDGLKPDVAYRARGGKLVEA